MIQGKWMMIIDEIRRNRQVYKVEREYIVIVVTSKKLLVTSKISQNYALKTIH